MFIYGQWNPNSCRNKNTRNRNGNRYPQKIHANSKQDRACMELNMYETEYLQNQALHIKSTIEMNIHEINMSTEKQKFEHRLDTSTYIKQNICNVKIPWNLTLIKL